MLRCTKCVMDASDIDIVFDHAGVCSHCRKAEALLTTVHFTPQESEYRIAAIRDRIKAAGRGNTYDSVIGLSGGVDSSFVAYVAHRLGLRPLAVHFDNGWNSETAVTNIAKIVEKCGFDLITYVINWPEFRDLQRSMLKASVIDIEIVTDHAITATVFQIARQYGIKTILLGTNIATEHSMPSSWLWHKQDLRNIKAIHRQYGELDLHSYPMLNTWNYLYYLYGRGFECVDLLNNLNYSKTDAVEILEREFDWQYYGGKHYESVFTKFYQAYLLPIKFGIDKRKAHFSDLIRNGELTRDVALSEISKPLYSDDDLQVEKRYVLKKLGFSETEFAHIMAAPLRLHSEFATDAPFVNMLRSVKASVKRARPLLRQLRAAIQS